MIERTAREDQSTFCVMGPRAFAGAARYVDPALRAFAAIHGPVRLSATHAVGTSAISGKMMMMA